MNDKPDPRPEIVDGERVYYNPPGPDAPEIPAVPMTTVRSLGGAGMVAHRYGVSFAASETARVPVDLARQMVREFPAAFAIDEPTPRAVAAPAPAREKE